MMWDLRGASRSPVPPPVIIPNTGPVAFPTPLNNLPPYEFPPPYAPLMSEPVVNGYGSNHIPFPASSPGYSPGYGHHGSRAPTPQAASPHYHHRTLSSAEQRHYNTPQPVLRSRSQSFTTQQGYHARTLSNSQGHHHSRSHSRPRHDSHQSQNHGRSHSHNHSRSHSRNHNGHAQQVAISQPIAAPYVPTTHHRSHSRSHSRSRRHHHHHHHQPQPQPQPQQPQVQFALRPEQYPEVPRMLGLSHHNVNTHAPAHNVPRPTHQSRTHPKFCYSKCTGRRKAVCIGINYAGSRNELQGCVNDATHVYHFLNEKYRYPRESMLFLTDTLSDPRARPTKKNILRAMQWLVEDAHPHDSLFFHYSGHGGQTKDLDGDEVDGYDEVIFPEDYQSAGTLTDDVMHDVMVRPLPPGCRLTAVFDSCHSGSILDLPYLYHSNGRAKGSQVSARFRADKTTPADVISWSGCKDSQTSADTTENGVAVGAMSYAFIKMLKRNPDISYQDLLRGIRAILKERYSQKPQLSSSHRIDTNLRFIM